MPARGGVATPPLANFVIIGYARPALDFGKILAETLAAGAATNGYTREAVARCCHAWTFMVCAQACVQAAEQSLGLKLRGADETFWLHLGTVETGPSAQFAREGDALALDVNDVAGCLSERWQPADDDDRSKEAVEKKIEEKVERAIKHIARLHAQRSS